MDEHMHELSARNLCGLFSVATDFSIEYLQHILKKYLKPKVLKGKLEDITSIVPNLSSEQIETIKDAAVKGYDDLDISTVYLLLRYVAIPPQEAPTNGWGICYLPEENHTTVGDNIERIRLLRNLILHTVFLMFTYHFTANNIYQIFRDIVNKDPDSSYWIERLERLRDRLEGISVEVFFILRSTFHEIRKTVDEEFISWKRNIFETPCLFTELEWTVVKTFHTSYFGPDILCKILQSMTHIHTKYADMDESDLDSLLEVYCLFTKRWKIRYPWNDVLTRLLRLDSIFLFSSHLPRSVFDRDVKNKNADTGLITELLSAETEKRRHIRLNVLGQEGVGKSHLCHRLLGLPTDSVTKTDGIDTRVLYGTLNLQTVQLQRAKEGGEGILRDRMSQALDSAKHDLLLKYYFSDIEMPSPNETAEKEKKTSSFAFDEEKSSQSDLSSELMRTEDLPGQERPMLSEELSKERKKFYEKVKQGRQGKQKDHKTLLSVWDYAGEDDFYATHHIFLSTDAVYIITFNAYDFIEDKEEALGRVMFWIRSVSTLKFKDKEGKEANPPVLFVGTHLDKVKKTFQDERKDTVDFQENINGILSRECKLLGLRRHVPELYLVNNLADDSEFQNLWNGIVQSAKHQSQWESEIPVRWIAFERDILQRKEKGYDTLTVAEVIQMAKNLEMPIEDPKEVQLFLDHLTNMGVILHLRENELIETNDVIINPRWLIDAFKNIITFDKVVNVSKNDDKARLRLATKIKQEGCFTHDEIQEMWNEDRFRGKVDTLLNFMKYLDLIAQPLPSSDVYFVPCLFKDKTMDEVREIMDEKANLTLSKTLCLDYRRPHHPMPPTLFDRLLAAFIDKYQFSLEKKSNEPFFGRGISLCTIDDDHRALIICKDDVIKITLLTHLSKVRQGPGGNIRSFLTTTIPRKAKLLGQSTLTPRVCIDDDPMPHVKETYFMINDAKLGQEIPGISEADMGVWDVVAREEKVPMRKDIESIEDSVDFIQMIYNETSETTRALLQAANLDDVVDDMKIMKEIILADGEEETNKLFEKLKTISVIQPDLRKRRVQLERQVLTGTVERSHRGKQCVVIFVDNKVYIRRLKFSVMEQLLDECIQLGKSHCIGNLLLITNQEAAKFIRGTLFTYIQKMQESLQSLASFLAKESSRGELEKALLSEGSDSTSVLQEFSGVDRGSLEEAAGLLLSSLETTVHVRYQFTRPRPVSPGRYLKENPEEDSEEEFIQVQSLGSPTLEVRRFANEAVEGIVLELSDLKKDIQQLSEEFKSNGSEPRSLEYSVSEFEEEKDWWTVCEKLEKEEVLPPGTDIYPARNGVDGEVSIIAITTDPEKPAGMSQEIIHEEKKILVFNYSSNSMEEETLQEKELPQYKETDLEWEEKLEGIINKFSKVLYCNHSKLQSISSSVIKSKRKGTDIEYTPCIVLYCPIKGYIPLGEQLFPEELDGIKTDVRESYVSLMAGDNLHDPIGMGSEIGRKGLHRYGSVGIFVEDYAKNIGFLTSAHTFITDKQMILDDVNEDGQFINQDQIEVVQPCHKENEELDANQVCGYIDKECGWFGDINVNDPITKQPLSVGVDIVYVKLTGRAPAEGFMNPKVDIKRLDEMGLYQWPSYDVHVSEVTKDDFERHVYKCGAKTSLTRGWIKKSKSSYRKGSYSFKTKDFPVTFENQYEIWSSTPRHVIDNQRMSPFFDHGDSGSAVFIVKNEALQPIGIVSAFKSSSGPGSSTTMYFATPLFAIQTVMERFCPSLRLLSFNSQENESGEGKGKSEVKGNETVMYSRES